MRIMLTTREYDKVMCPSIFTIGIMIKLCSMIRECLQTIFGADNIIVTLSIPPLSITSHNK